MSKEQINSGLFTNITNINSSTFVENVEERDFLKEEIVESKKNLKELKCQLLELEEKISFTKKEIKLKKGTIRKLNWSIFKIKTNNNKIYNEYSKGKKVNTKKYTK